MFYMIVNTCYANSVVGSWEGPKWHARWFYWARNLAMLTAVMGAKLVEFKKGQLQKIRVDFLEDLLFGDDHLGQKCCLDFRSRGGTQFVVFASCAGGRRRERSFWWSCRRKDEHDNYFSCTWAMICFPDQSVLDLQKVLHDVSGRSHSPVDPLLIYCLPASLLHHHPFIQSLSPAHSSHFQAFISFGSMVKVQPQFPSWSIEKLGTYRLRWCEWLSQLC